LPDYDRACHAIRSADSIPTDCRARLVLVRDEWALDFPGSAGCLA
jgi:hypothetical protein